MQPRALVVFDMQHRTVNGRHIRGYDAARDAFLAQALYEVGYDKKTEVADQLATLGCHPVYVAVGRARGGGIWAYVRGTPVEEIARFDTAQSAWEWIKEAAYARYMARAEQAMEDFDRVSSGRMFELSQAEYAGRADWIRPKKQGKTEEKR